MAMTTLLPGLDMPLHDYKLHHKQAINKAVDKAAANRTTVFEYAEKH